jgi:hypothetical protein
MNDMWTHTHWNCVWQEQIRWIWNKLNFFYLMHENIDTLEIISVTLDSLSENWKTE